MPERRVPQEHVDYILDKIRGSSEGYDLKELVHLAEQERKLSWLEVGAALDLVLKEGLVKPLELDENRRPYIISRK